jgi:deazaflavin-dependent oxidoreductase (nitroreductase family)
MIDFNERNRKTIEAFRTNGGKVGGIWEGKPLLLLTTTGAKSGQKRTTPLMYLADGDRLLIFASKGGAPTSPDWYHNVLAHPTVTVEVGNETFEANARVITGEERDRLYAKQAQLYPQFADYQTKTNRKIPVIALERRKPNE